MNSEDKVEATSPSLPEVSNDAFFNQFSFFDPSMPIGFLCGNLPHWRQQGTMYFVTFRTADSIPSQRIKRWLEERADWMSNHPEPHDEKTRLEYYRLFPCRWQNWLDECLGACLLRRPEIKRIVEEALHFYDGTRYKLDEYIVMPNHVHVLVAPSANRHLSEIVGGWKSFTAHTINRITGLKGSFWQKESFDHIVRKAEQLDGIRRYIRNNFKK